MNQKQTGNSTSTAGVAGRNFLTGIFSLGGRIDPAQSVFTTVGITVIIILLAIFALLVMNSLPFFTEYNFSEFLTGTRWQPTSSIEKDFGILAFITSTLLVTFGAMLISIPLGIGVALYLSEVAPYKIREILKPLIEVLASIPSVVVGFLGVTLLGPLISAVFGLPGNGLNALNGSILLSIMALPTIISLSEDALQSVPNSFREASYALGANKWETMTRVVLPGARSGIFAAIMLGMGRAIGETMTVLMACGNALNMPFTSLAELFQAFLQSVTTLTATIAIELGETQSGSLHYHALFAVGFVLFIITFLINMAADMVLRRQEKLMKGLTKQTKKKKRNSKDSDNSNDSNDNNNSNNSNNSAPTKTDEGGTV